jgi:hypothetical protein
MCHRSEAELDVDVLTVLLEVLALELGPVIGDDSVRDIIDLPRNSII